MNKFLKSMWALCLAMAIAGMAGCGGNDGQASDELSGSALASSAQSSPGQSAASDQYSDEVWHQAASLSATELQAAEKAAERSRTERSATSWSSAKGVANRLAVYRFYNSQTAAHFFTTSVAERDSVIASLPQFHYEGQAFWAAATASGGMSPVYRFFNQLTGVHFYTISVDERDFIQASMPVLRYEGVAYYASKTAGAGLSPLHRFYLSSKGFHFYSASAQEADRVRSELPQYKYEGVAYYLPTSADGSFTTFMGQDKILIGGMLDNTTVRGAPFDVRYAYVHSRPAPAQACYVTCDEGCNSGPDGGWWGCWGSSDYDRTSGTYITWWNNESATATYQLKPMIQHWTWYSLEDLAKAAGDLNLAAGGSGDPDYPGAINNPTLLRGYLDDYRFFLKKIGTSRTMIQLEPDFWGFVRSRGSPHAVPAAVKAASRDDCASEDNSAAGLASCLIKMTRKYAPASAVGIHTSCWDWDRPDSPTEGPQACAAYYRELGAGKGDFIASDAADRDAAWAVQNDPVWGPRYWWDDAKFSTYLNLIRTVTEGVGKPMVIWQIPLGNEWQNNTMNNWQDNKVRYMFDRIEDLADVHVAALLFGAGHHEQTSTETDDGYMLNKAREYYNRGGVQLR